MTTLDDAWAWYNQTKAMLKLVARLGKRHWGDLDWDGALGRDEKVSRFDAGELLNSSRTGLEPLDDLAILVLFSVFEALVRDGVRSEVEREGGGLRHITLRHSLGEALKRVEEGSFFQVLEPFKEIDADLVEEVNQVRRYRNWVAHGRRQNKKPDHVHPELAYERLGRFVELLMTQSIRTGETTTKPD